MLINLSSFDTKILFIWDAPNYPHSSYNCMNFSIFRTHVSFTNSFYLRNSLIKKKKKKIPTVPEV